MTDTKKKLGLSALLNKPSHHSVAAISALLSTEKTYGQRRKRNELRVDGELSISDCNRSIYIDFNYGTRKERENALFKLDVLIDLLTKVKEWVEMVDAEKLNWKK